MATSRVVVTEAARYSIKRWRLQQSSNRPGQGEEIDGVNSQDVPEAPSGRIALLLKRSSLSRYWRDSSVYPIRRSIGMLLGVAGTVTCFYALNTHRSANLLPYVPLYLAFGLATVVLISAAIGLALTRPAPGIRTEVRPLSWWWIPGGLLVITLSIWAIMAILLALANKSSDASKRAEMKADAIKTSLTVGAGAAGGAALLLSIRRQWLAERSQAHSEYDSTERRVTDLYTKAADQLGHDKAAVRLAGLYALERVAQTNPDHRQTVTSVICAYLRMPFPLDSEKNEASSAETSSLTRAAKNTPSHSQELQVRLAAQNILTTHLIWPPWEDIAPSSFWENMDVDLSGAHLSNISLENCRMRRAEFMGTTFQGQAFFARAVFKGVPWGRRGPTGLGGARFDGAAFKHGAVFEDASFEADASFNDAAFESYAYFGGVDFHGATSFSHALFSESTEFEGSTFYDGADFRHCHFAGPVSFQNESIYTCSAEFLGVREADFRNARFDAATSFKHVKFEGPIITEGGTEGGVTFMEAVAKKDPFAKRIWPAEWKEEPHSKRSGYNRLMSSDERTSAQ
jgi:uncharacterized protein YjbI with pentapeptide repeats